MNAAAPSAKKLPRRNTLRDTVLPRARIMTQTEVDAVLTQVIRKGAVKAGWIAPCARREGGRDSVYYATADVREVEDRVLRGELPPNDF